MISSISIPLFFLICSISLRAVEVKLEVEMMIPDSLYFFIDRKDDYNEVMGQYHYELLASYGYLDKRFIIANESDLISDALATNSYPYLHQYLKDYPIYPKSFVIVFS